MRTRNRQKSSFRPLTDTLEQVAGASSLALGIVAPEVLGGVGVSPAVLDESAFSTGAGSQDPDPASSNNAAAASNPVAPVQTQPEAETSGGSGGQEAPAAAASGVEAEVDSGETVGVDDVDPSASEEDVATTVPQAQAPSGGGPTDSGGVGSNTAPPSATVGNNVPSAANALANVSGGGGFVSGVALDGDSSTAATAQTPGAKSDASAAAQPAPAAAAASAPTGSTGTQSAAPSTVAATAASPPIVVANAHSSGPHLAKGPVADHTGTQATASTQNASIPTTATNTGAESLQGSGERLVHVKHIHTAGANGASGTGSTAQSGASIQAASAVTVHPMGPVSALSQGSGTSVGQAAGQSSSLTTQSNAPAASGSQQGALQSISIVPVQKSLSVGQADATQLTKRAKADLDSGQFVTAGGSGIALVAGARDQALAEAGNRRNAYAGTHESSRGTSGTYTTTTWQNGTETTYSTWTTTIDEWTITGDTTTTTTKYITTAQTLTRFSTTGWSTIRTTTSTGSTSTPSSSSQGNRSHQAAPVAVVASNGDGPSQAAPAALAAPGGSGISQAALAAVAGSNATVGSGVYLREYKTAPYQSQQQTSGTNLQHTSVQANPELVFESELTIPVGGSPSAITAISAQITLAGVNEGTITYTPPAGGLSDGTTYDIQVELDPPALAPGVQPYTMTVTEQFGAAADASKTISTIQSNVDVVNSYSADGEVITKTNSSAVGDRSNYLGLQSDQNVSTAFVPWQADRQSSAESSPVAVADAKIKHYHFVKDKKGKIIGYKVYYTDVPDKTKNITARYGFKEVTGVQERGPQNNVPDQIGQRWQFTPPGAEKQAAGRSTVPQEGAHHK